MNIANITALRDFIAERTDLKFNMRNPSIGPYGGCVGAFAAVLWPETGYHGTLNEKLLAAKLGINYRTALQIVYPYDELGKIPGGLSGVRRFNALHMLDNLMATGEVNYDL